MSMKTVTITALTGLAAASAFGMAHAAPAPAASGFSVVDRISGPDGGGWDYVSVDSVNNRVLQARGTTVVAFDLKTKTAANIGAAIGAHAAIAVNGGKEILVTNGSPSTVTFLDGKTGALIATVPTGKGPDAATVDDKAGVAMIMDHAGGDVVMIDLKTHTATGTITVGGTLEAGVMDGAGLAYVNIEDSGTVAVLDLKTKTVKARYQLADCKGPTGLAYDRDDKYLIVACSGAAQIVDAVTGKLVKSIPDGPGTDGTVFDQKAHLAFMPAGGDGTLSIISVRKDNVSLVETIPTQKGARTIGIDESTGRVYMAATKTDASGGGLGKVAPGSFTMLVVGK
ncbi:MAG: hypothetical protein JWM33_832 [Caulobacteraceae bacterium]|nr:hypothetical protein [Caulobacteraceae bacterium]